MNYPERPTRPARPKRRTFGLSWWGNAWVEAVEQLSDLDQNRLARGRIYARWGYVGPLTIEAGVVKARVAGSRATPYHTYVKVKAFTDEEWNALLDVVAGKVAHAAALIDSELTSELVDDAHAAGIELLPTPGDITPGCSCPDTANPCKHSAAVCYLIADLLDEDPFALLNIRGRTQSEISDALRLRRRQAIAPASTLLETDQVIAKIAFTQRSLGPLPNIPKAPIHPGKPAHFSELPANTLDGEGDDNKSESAPALNSNVDPLDLEILARATAQRAWEMCNGIGNSGLKDSAHLDLVRRLAPLLDTPEFDKLCGRSRRIKSSVEQDARLWIKGGTVAIAEAESSWYPDEDSLIPAIKHLEQSGTVNVHGNRVTCKSAGRQLRLGESGQWYEYHLHGTQWRFTDLTDL